MKKVIVLQSRMSSTRLPGKALLPVGGYPMVVLAAKRLANTGLNVIVATSNHSSDDLLVSTLRKESLEFCRGDLNNTLHRFWDALRDYNDEDIVIRTTADNVFPDGEFIDEMLADFLSRQVGYLVTSSDESGLPYGVSAEIMHVSALRELRSTEVSLTNHDLEHVTPKVRDRYGVSIYEKYSSLNLGHLRCTIDTFSDYVSIASLFTDTNAESISWKDLCKTLVLRGDSPEFSIAKKSSPLVLGTAQIGLNYGIVNKDDLPSKAAAAALVNSAIRHGVVQFDSARAYGDSESKLAYSLKGCAVDTKIITKLSPLSDIDSSWSTKAVFAAVDASVYQSCKNLESSCLDTLLLHRAEQLSLYGGEIWRRLLTHRDSGLIKNLGVSVQSPQELKLALSLPDIKHIQMPFNILDWRWRETFDSLLKAQKNGVVIHTRSAFLQGLLTTNDVTRWPVLNTKQAQNISDAMQSLVAELGRANCMDLCVAYVRAHKWVGGVVVGVDNLEQLSINMSLFRSTPLSASEIEKVNSAMPPTPEKLLDPAQWNTKP